MRAFHDDAIVLEVADLQEADRVVGFLSREHGYRRGAARGAKRKWSRFAGQLQPMARVRVGWVEKEGRQLVRLDALELLAAPKRLGSDLEGLLVGSYLGESVATFAPEGEPAERLYRLLDASVQALEHGAPKGLVLRYFESWLLRLAGVFPPPDDCPHCGRPLVAGDVRLAGSGEALLCGSCAGENPGALTVSGAALDFFRRAGRESPERMAESPPPARTLDEIEEIVGRIRRHFLQGEIRSYQVARRTIASLEESGAVAPTPPSTRPGPTRRTAV